MTSELTRLLENGLYTWASSKSCGQLQETQDPFLEVFSRNTSPGVVRIAAPAVFLFEIDSDVPGIFWIILPISGTSFFLLFFFLDVHNPRTPFIQGLKAIDWYGSASMLGITVMLLLVLDLGGSAFAWKSPTVIGLIVSSSLMFLTSIIVEKKLAKYPLMPLGLFKDRSNVASLAFGFFHDFVGPPPYI